MSDQGEHRAIGPLTDEQKAVVIEVLCSQSLADHLGDVRDAESKLWDLIGAPKLPYDDPAWDSDSAFRFARARLRAAGLSLPSYLQGDDDDDEGSQHTATLVISHGTPYLDSKCPFDREDQSRPCWPHTEDGKRYDPDDGAAAGCVYADWINEQGIDAVTNHVEVTFSLRATWQHDYFSFELGEVIPNA